MKFYLAPMEGITGYVYRKAHKECFGSLDRYFTPFLASKKLSAKEKKEVSPDNNINMEVIPQILTNRVDEFLAIARQLEQRGYTTVNLNLGCPSGTVTAKNRGAGFLKVPDNLEKFLDEIFRECPLKISVKTRIGAYYIEEFEKIIEIYNKFPFEELIIHPRLMTDFYNGEPKYEIFEQAISQSIHPLCYNGDINSVRDYELLMERFPNIDRIMLGRGLLANPGLVGEIKGEPPITIDKLREFHALLYEAYKEEMSDERNTLFKMKELWTFMSRFFVDSENILRSIRKAGSYMEYEIAVRNAMKMERR